MQPPSAAFLFLAAVLIAYKRKLRVQKDDSLESQAKYVLDK